MQWSELLSRLEVFAPRYSGEEKQEVFGYEMIMPGLKYNESVLYIGWTSQLDIIDGAGVPEEALLLCIEDVPLSGSRYRNLALLDETAHLDHIVQKIVEILAGESRTHAGTKKLLAAYNTNSGLQHIVDVATEILGNPMFVADVSFKILAVSEEPFVDRPEIENQRELGYLSAENVSDLKRDHVHDRARRSSVPYYSLKEDGEGWMTAVVYLNSVEVAYIDIMERDKAFDSGDFEIVRFMSGLVSLELQKNDFFKLNRGFLHSYFLSELLEGQIPDTDVVNLRLQHLNWTPSDYLYIMVVSDNQPGAMDRKSNIIATQLHNILPGSRWAMYNGALVFLLCFSHEDSLLLEPGDPVDRYLEINNLTAAVSARFKDLLYTRQGYSQAIKARELGRRLDSKTRIYYYPEYVFEHIGDIVSHEHELTGFLHPVIAEIIKYDKEHKTSLLKTLEQHLLFGDNPTLVASNLFIHRNTLFYRIAKIKELFNISMSGGEERAHLLLSIKFLRLISKGT